MLNAKQKHLRCKKSEAKLEATVSSYSYTRLKSVISGITWIKRWPSNKLIEVSGIFM